MLFQIHERAQVVTTILVGEKRGEALLVQGKEFSGHHELIPLSEAKAHLRQYGRLCHDEPVIVTVNGVPSFQLVPLEEDDDLIDRLLEHRPSFRKMLKARLRERSITAREAFKRL